MFIRFIIIFQKKNWKKFLTSDKLVTFSIFLRYPELYFLFIDMNIVLVMAKNGYSVKDSFSF